MRGKRFPRAKKLAIKSFHCGENVYTIEKTFFSFPKFSIISFVQSEKTKLKYRVHFITRTIKTMCKNTLFFNADFFFLRAEICKQLNHMMGFMNHIISVIYDLWRHTIHIKLHIVKYETSRPRGGQAYYPSHIQARTRPGIPDVPRWVHNVSSTI